MHSTSAFELSQPAEQTCKYGFVGPSCTATYASYNLADYHLSQWIYFSLGAAGLIASALQYGRATRNSGSRIQKKAYFVTFFCSATFSVRAVDPGSYGGTLPRVVFYLMIHLCTAALYSILLNSAFFLMSVTHGTASKRSWRSIDTEQSAVLLIWIYYGGIDSLALDHRGFYRIPKTYRYIGDALLLTLILMVLLVYGWQVLQRVHEIDSMEEADIPMTMIRFISTMDDAGMLGRQHEMEHSYHAHLHANVRKPYERFRRMKRVLSVATISSVIAMATQFYVMFSMSGETDEVMCSTTGERCQYLTGPISPLHYIQFLGVVGLMWGFGRIQKLPSSGHSAAVTPMGSRQAI